MSSTSNLTLPALYRRTLHSLLPIFNDDISSSLPSTQQTLQDSLTDLDLVIRMSSTLGIFSDNEQVDDVGDGELPLMAVEWIKGEVLGRVNGDGIKERLKVLKSSQVSVDSPFDFASCQPLLIRNAPPFTPLVLIVILRILPLPARIILLPHPPWLLLPIHLFFRSIHLFKLHLEPPLLHGPGNTERRQD